MITLNNFNHFIKTPSQFSINFQNQTLSWNTDDPDLTPCFQQTVLVWIPCIFFIVLSPIEFHFIKHSKYSNIPWGFLNVSRLVISSVLVGLTVSDFITANTLRGTAGVYDVFIVTPVIKLITFVC